MPSKHATGKKKEDWIPLAHKIVEKPEETPNLMKRCIVDVLKAGNLKGGVLQEKFEGAVAICGSSLRKTGRFNKTAPLDVMELTAIGKRSDRERMKQPDQSRKRTAFNNLMRMLRRIRKDKETEVKAKAGS